MNLTISITDPERRRQVEIARGEVMSLGRSPRSKICLNDGLCSSLHGQISFDENDIFIEDLNSKNGIYLNGEKISEKTKFFIGDEVRLGNTFVHLTDIGLSDLMKKKFTNPQNQTDAFFEVESSQSSDSSPNFFNNKQSPITASLNNTEPTPPRKIAKAHKHKLKEQHAFRKRSAISVELIALMSIILGGALTYLYKKATHSENLDTTVSHPLENDYSIDEQE